VAGRARHSSKRFTHRSPLERGSTSPSAWRARLTRLAGVLLLLACGVACCSCGGASYALAVRGAARHLDEARALGAEEKASYPYYFARAHLEEAEELAATGAYGDALRFVDTADAYAVEAVAASRGAPEGEPVPAP
jgi:hypothetical protein